MASKSSFLSLRFLFFLFLLAALIPVAFAGWSQITPFLEYTAPKIVVDERIRGVGITPVSMRVIVTDEGSGLDEVVIRTDQRGRKKVLLREALGGRPESRITFDFPGRESDLDEGSAMLEIRAFDKSFWSNTASISVPLEVDFRKPRVEVITTQHNAVHGGSQLVFYKAYDESLAISGVKVGTQIFVGFPARGISESLEESSLFVSLYAANVQSNPAAMNVRAFAEDRVGNVTSTTFYNRIQSQRWRKVSVKIKEEYLREVIAPLYEAQESRINSARVQSGKPSEFSSERGTAARLVEEFERVNEDLREISSQELAESLVGPRFDRYWDGAFVQQPGATIQRVFGDIVNYSYGGGQIGTRRSDGYEFSFPKARNDVVAANSGIVIFSDNIGTYGRVLAIDHGLGLVSIYGWLDNVVVRRGDKVKKGEKIAEAGGSGLSSGSQLYFEMRLHGVAINPREWFDKRWYYSHITSKINEIKKLEGIPVYRPLG